MNKIEERIIKNMLRSITARVNGLSMIRTDFTDPDLAAIYTAIKDAHAKNPKFDGLEPILEELTKKRNDLIAKCMELTTEIMKEEINGRRKA
jgi:hypothetical protein